jgi:hypothetical protein
MKKFGQTLILLIAAATVFFTGAGVTIMNYCCTTCSGQTLFMTEQHVCCAQARQVEDVSGCCSVKATAHHNTFKSDTHCTASRLSIDIDASSFRPQVATPFIWISDASLAVTLSIFPEKVEYTDEYAQFESPPGIPPRDYLSLIRVLII